MLRRLKRKLYFPLACYFRFFAKIQLALWKPKVVVVTGSSGKTTLLHLIESQLKNKARYSHQANSAFGIPFDILGLKRPHLVVSEWPFLFLLAPFRAFKKPFKERLYIVEADCDRPKEGKFLASLLKPEVTLWLGSSRTHSVNFDPLVSRGKFQTVEQAIAHEFGYFLEQTTGQVIVNGDSEPVASQVTRLQAPVVSIKKQEALESYSLTLTSTVFMINKKQYTLKELLPEESFYALAMTTFLLAYLGFKSDDTYSGFKLPPGRSSVFKGIKNTTLIDSSYNATLDGMRVILKMFALYPAKTKWAVLGDMLELGVKEQEEHEKLAELISQVKLEKIILMGPRVFNYTYPKLTSLVKDEAEILRFAKPIEALDYLTANIKGGEAVLFKGARFLEGVIDQLLVNRSDVAKLCRREKVWQLRRKSWKL